MRADGWVRENKRGWFYFDDKDLHLLGMFFDSFVGATSESSCTFVSSVFLRPFPPCPHPSCTSTLHSAPPRASPSQTPHPHYSHYPHCPQRSYYTHHSHCSHNPPSVTDLFRFRTRSSRRRTGSNAGSVGRQRRRACAPVNATEASPHGNIDVRRKARAQPRWQRHSDGIGQGNRASQMDAAPQCSSAAAARSAIYK